MDAIEMIKGRRSVRKYKQKKVDREMMKQIVEVSRFAPSWGNFQVARYTFVYDEATIKRLAHDGVNEFVYNINTLKEAANVAVLSFVKGKSGKLDTDEYVTSKAQVWEVFDAGLACQTFCLAAHEKGIGTVVMGVINDEAISEIIGLPAEETVAALIVYGYPDEQPDAPQRKPVEELVRFV